MYFLGEDDRKANNIFFIFPFFEIFRGLLPPCSSPYDAAPDSEI